MAFQRYSINFTSSIRSWSLVTLNRRRVSIVLLLIQTVAILGLISGEPQKCGLLTFRNAKRWSDLVLCTHTHTDTHIPEGARWGWKQEVVKFTPARVRTVIYPHHSQGQQMWQDRVRKEWGVKERKNDIYLSVSIVSIIQIAPSVNSYCSLGPTGLFVWGSEFHSSHFYCTHYRCLSVRHYLLPLFPNGSSAVNAERLLQFSLLYLSVESWLGREVTHNLTFIHIIFIRESLTMNSFRHAALTLLESFL